MTIEEAIKDQRLDLRVFCLLRLFRIASRGVRRSVAFGIDIRSEKDILAIRRPEFATRLGRDVRVSPDCRDCSSRAVEMGDPDLRAAVFIREESERLPSGAQRGRSAS